MMTSSEYMARFLLICLPKHSQQKTPQINTVLLKIPLTSPHYYYYWL